MPEGDAPVLRRVEGKAAETGPGMAEEMNIPDYVMLDFVNDEGATRKSSVTERGADIGAPPELLG
jgi:hypothetical protein